VLITLGLWLGRSEGVTLGLPVADGESLGLLVSPFDGDRVLLFGVSDGITLGLWLG
jgi:hypothetical protein